MSVTEQHMGVGSWSLKLDKRAPLDLLDTIKFFGTVMFFPQWIDPRDFSDSQIRALSGYSGVVMRIRRGSDAETIISGTGLAGLLGEGGYLYRTLRDYIPRQVGGNQQGRTLTQVMKRTVNQIDYTDPAAIGPNSTDIGLFHKDDGNSVGLRVGTITDPSGGAVRYVGSIILQYPLPAIESVLDIWSQTAIAQGYISEPLEWRINPYGDFDIGRQADLFRVINQSIKGDTDEHTLITASPGFSPEHRQVLTLGMESIQDAEDYAHRMVVTSSSGDYGEVPVASVFEDAWPVNVERRPIIPGGGLSRVAMRRLPNPDMDKSQAKEYAQKELAKAIIRQEVTLDLANYEISGADFSVGDTVYIYDPVNGLYDSSYIDPNLRYNYGSSEVYYEGRAINPIQLRVLQNSWNVTSDMGVAYRDYQGEYTDITRWIIPEENISKANITNMVGAK